MHGNLSLNKVQLGKPLPIWHLEKIFDEPELPLKEKYFGKPLVILFFSLGCPGCIGRAVPFANRLVYEYGDKINVLGIHTFIEGMEYDRPAFEKAKDELYIRFLFFRDYKYNTTYLDFGAGGTPHWIVVNKDGNVEYSIFGSDPNSALLRLGYLLDEIV